MARRGRTRGGRGGGGRGTREQYQGGGRYQSGGGRWQSGYDETSAGRGYTSGGYPRYGTTGSPGQRYGRWENEPRPSGDFGETDVGLGAERQGRFTGDRYQGDYRGSEFETGRGYGRAVGPEELRFPVGNREGGWGAGESDVAERDYERPVFGRGPHSGRGPRNYARTDERISEEVCELLTDAGELDASNIDVRIENGEVTLEGTVSDRRAKRLAEDIAEQARGVRDVHNRLRVAGREGEEKTGVQ